MATHSDDNQLSMEEKVPDDIKNKDITEEDDENVNIFQLLLTLFMTFTL